MACLSKTSRIEGACAACRQRESVAAGFGEAFDLPLLAALGRAVVGPSSIHSGRWTVVKAAGQRLPAGAARSLYQHLERHADSMQDASAFQPRLDRSAALERSGFK
jgi:hypothetical protein